MDELENKKRYFYAEINENNICYSLLDTPTTIEAENMIEVESYDMSLIGKKYTDGNWIEYVSESNETENSKNETENSKNETEISDAELIQAEMLLNQESIIAKQNEQDEILAELLLGQQKGV